MQPRRLGYLFLAVSFGLLALSDTGILAQPDAGYGSVDRPLILPADSDTLTYSAQAEVSAWVRIPVYTSDGKKRPLPMAIAVKQRSHWVGANVGLDELRSVKFSAIRYSDAAGEQHSLDLAGIATGGHVPHGAATDVHFDKIEEACKKSSLPLPDWSAPFRLTYQHLDRDRKASATRIPVLVIWQVFTDGGEHISALNAGPRAYVLRSPEPYQRASDFAQARGLQAADFATPDLFACFDGRPQVGDLLFVPLGQFEFASVPGVVRAFDGAGVDLISSGALALGKAAITASGELKIPVESVKTEVADLVLIARGVKVFVHEDASDDTVQCYTVGGHAVARARGNVAAVASGKRLLDNWQTARAPQSPHLGGYPVPLWDEEHGQVNLMRIGEEWPRPALGAEAGFLTAIAIMDTYDPSMTTGRLVVRPIWGWKFVHDPHTKLYAAVGGWDNAIDVSNEVSASISVDVAGSIIVELTKVPKASVDGLDLVLVNPRIEVTAKLAYGDLLQFNVYGGALPQPVRENEVLQWTIDADAAPSASTVLPKQPPIKVRDWKAVASMD